MFNIGQKTIYTCILAFVQIAGIALFCKGFFPYKIYLPGYASRGDQFSLHEQPQEPEFDRLVFVLIDALRNDFLIGKDSGFDFVNSQIEQGSAFPFTAKATAPTVTLPRIKALTTGTIPSFLDAILNIAESDTTSSLDNHDNWVYQFKKQNKTIHFFGDDTWMRLFPTIFDKTDGTTSFFVSDTTEVDANVTRHIKTDLAKEDWDAVIFHYLGLDHVGHLGGPQSPLMKPKQREMDQAIESMYAIVAQQDAKRMQEHGNAKGTLIVVCGDHGMNDKGNHGGSSIGETSAGLVFMSPRFESRPSRKKQQPLGHRQTVLGFPVVDQIDIVPTLATLFSFPIPKNNLGKVIVDLYDSNRQDYTSILNSILLNASQLGQLLSKLIPEISAYLETPFAHANDATLPFGQSYALAISTHRKYLITRDESTAKQALALYDQFIEFAQSHLSNTATDYNVQFMMMGVALMSSSTIGFIYLSLLQQHEQQQLQRANVWRFSQYFSVFTLMMYASSMFASSFVEEEHCTWYYFLQTVTLLCAISSFCIPVASLGQALYPVGLCFAQLLLIRTAIAWKDDALSNFILSYSGVQWHLLGCVLLTAVLFGFKALRQLSNRSAAIDVHATAKIIQNLVMAAMLVIMTLISVLVFIYKMRAAADLIENEVPGMYASLLDWKLVQPLDQVKLGKLIYNYGGAGLFVLGGLFYVTKKALLMDLVHDDDDNDDEPDDAGQLQAQRQAQAQVQGAIEVDGKRTLILEMLLYLITPLLILLSRPQNAILFLFFLLQFKLLKKFQLHLQDNKHAVPTWLIGVLITCLSQASFFLTGHGNSIASVDLSHAYVGVQEYDNLLIGVLTFFSNWSGSIWWSVAGWSFISQEEKRWFSYLSTQTILFSVAMTTLSVSATLLREHLFIWTVFSPKYLYQIAWNVLFHWTVQVFIGSIITQVFLCV